MVDFFFPCVIFNRLGFMIQCVLLYSCSFIYMLPPTHRSGNCVAYDILRTPHPFSPPFHYTNGLTLNARGTMGQETGLLTRWTSYSRSLFAMPRLPRLICQGWTQAVRSQKLGSFKFASKHPPRPNTCNIPKWTPELHSSAISQLGFVVGYVRLRTQGVHLNEIVPTQIRATHVLVSGNTSVVQVGQL